MGFFLEKRNYNGRKTTIANKFKRHQNGQGCSPILHGTIIQKPLKTNFSMLSYENSKNNKAILSVL